MNPLANSARTEISAIGEFGLIDRIRSMVDLHVKDFPARENLLHGIGDDTAVFRPSPGCVQLLTTDALVEGVHFDLTFTALKHLGWKAMAASISDIAAMGGEPRYATITLSIPRKISVEMIEELYEGILFACKQYGCLPVGGDMTTSMANLVISVALTGEAPEHRVYLRSGARPGDYLCVSGHLGSSVAGLKILQREKDRFLQSTEQPAFRPNLEPYTPAIEKHLMPKPRLDIARLFRDDITPHAVIDISDGLASEVHHLCSGSDVGAAIYEHNLPIEFVTQRIAEEFGDSPTDYALYGGEEYELLFSISEQDFAKLDVLTNDVTIIGRVQGKSDGIDLVREQGDHMPLTPGGWNHFR